LHQRLGVALAAKGERSAALDEFGECLKSPLSGVPYSPRITWPKDVHAFCRQETRPSPGGKPN
jgi:hypothetical protein